MNTKAATPTQTGALVGLARVSTDDQDLQLQLDALTAAGCIRIFDEKVSTRKKDRPGLAAALDYLRPGDTLVVWKLDRLGRSTKDVLIIAEDLHDQGIGLKILTGRLAGNYSPTGEGKFFFTMMAAFAELERDIIRERTIAGVQAARDRGQRLGRPPAMTPEQVEHARTLLTNPKNTVSSIARLLNVSRATIYKYVPELTQAPAAAAEELTA
ncbi:recombinase family protein [Nonomuraea roseoviolacea]|uniref:DNA invertase Pin-like site-specific DNA recombinase n=1 Tax=Nonomuraea roseoviolacea subsp. carminata TaxID=160689 RepID=A0ABT1K9G7_9ACTN|nr:recombinase family protein [Nonomuraea roseoviolacea]MCP2350640.1 DNA invertase Pin-like site-specific DNA recombinase [Nonomuraea roseoviolacea subsp. carminata]